MAKVLRQEQALQRAFLALTTPTGPRSFGKSWLLDTAMRRRVFKQNELPKLPGLVRQGGA